jgi:hypothetical protein
MDWVAPALVGSTLTALAVVLVLLGVQANKLDEQVKQHEARWKDIQEWQRHHLTRTHGGTHVPPAALGLPHSDADVLEELRARLEAEHDLRGRP